MTPSVSARVTVPPSWLMINGQIPVLHCRLHDVFTMVDGYPSMWRGDVRFTWVNMGEGHDGAFDERLPGDVNLLRFDGHRRIDGEWVEIDDSSYCTLMPATSSYQVLRQALIHLMDSAHDEIVAYGKAKRTLEHLSWMSREDFAPDHLLASHAPVAA